MLRRHRSYSSTGWNGPPNTGKRGAASLPVVGPHEWRHESGPTHRPSYFPRPEDERQIIRRKSFTLPTSTVDEAALQLDLLDYDSPVHREGHEHRQCPLPCRTDGLPSGTSEPSIGRVAGRLRAARDRQSAASAAAYCWASRRTPRPARPTLPLLPWRRPRPWQSAVSPPRRALRAPHPAS